MQTGKRYSVLRDGSEISSGPAENLLDWRYDMKILKWVHIFFEALRLIWQERRNGGRQKWRRIARGLDNKGRVLGLTK
jgi:hypothetical protein